MGGGEGVGGERGWDGKGKTKGVKKRGKEGRREGRRGEERKILTPDSYMGFGYRKDLKEFTELLHSQSESESHSVVSDSFPWNSPGQNTGVGSLSLLQGIFPTQGLNLGLPHCRQVLYQLSYRGSL